MLKLCLAGVVVYLPPDKVSVHDLTLRKTDKNCISERDQSQIFADKENHKAQFHICQIYFSNPKIIWGKYASDKSEAHIFWVKLPFTSAYNYCSISYQNNIYPDSEVMVNLLYWDLQSWIWETLLFAVCSVIPAVWDTLIRFAGNYKMFLLIWEQWHLQKDIRWYTTLHSAGMYGYVSALYHAVVF